MTGDVPIVADGLSAETIARTLARRAADAAQETVPPAATLSVLLCTIADDRYALPLGDVWSVAPRVAVTRVPGTPAALLGLFAHRGVVHNLLDPSIALGGTGGVADGAVVVLRRPGPRIAILVDAIIGVGAVPAGTPADALSVQIVAGDGAALALLDPDRLVAHLLERPLPPKE